MAERRMFAKTIIDSDAFLDMPLSTQSLYFHLSMRADDDGFINNPKKIQRMIGCADDDLKLLFAKNFIIPFENGVCVIKHWKIHNYIRNDRYKPTVYAEERAQLTCKENGAYTLGIPNGYQTETQVRLGQDSIGKLSIGKGEDVIVDALPPHEKTDYQQIVDLYHSICISFPKIRSVSAARAKAIKARLKTFSLDDFRTVFENAEASSFLKGSNDRNWTATFDWLIKDSNMAKVLEGNYADKIKHSGKGKLPGWEYNPDKYLANDSFIETAKRMLAEEPQTAGNDPAIAERAELLRQQLQG